MRSTGKRCWPSTLKSVHVPFAQSVNQRQPLQQVSGNAMTRSTFAASAQSIMQTSARRGNATCASCGMRKKTFQRNIASVNVVFSVCAWRVKWRSFVSNVALRNQKPNLGRPHGKHATRTAAAAENVPPNSRAVGNVPSAAIASHEQSFTAWQQSRKYTQNGTQVCNACTALALVCRLAHRTNRRLARLRQRETCQRHEAILADVRKEIQKIHEARQTSTGAEEATTDAPHSATQQLAATPRVYTYICPHCTKSVQSTVAAGQVDHRRGDGCGKNSRC